MKSAVFAVRKVLGKVRRRLNKAYRSRQIARLYAAAAPVSPLAGSTLFWQTGGMPQTLHIEAAIAAALRLRGSPVHAVICDGTYKACMRREITHGIPLSRWHESCSRCMADMAEMLEIFAIPYSTIGALVPAERRVALKSQARAATWENLGNLNYEGLNVGEAARSSILRYLQGESAPQDLKIVQEYAFSALVCAAAATRALDLFKPSRLFMSHGVYADWAPAMQIAFSCELPVTSWSASYLRQRYFFRTVAGEMWIDPHRLSDEAWQTRRQSPLTAGQQARLDGFLADRYRKSVSFDIKCPKKYSGESERLRQEYAPLSHLPVWGIMSHINWDVVSSFSPMSYPNFNEWILDTVHEIVHLPEVCWLIKIHPSEGWYSPAYGVEALIRNHFPQLPPHVRVVSATDTISPLDFFQIIDGCATVYGTSGLECALRGKPVILAGQAHYSGKGFTLDGGTAESYRQLLRQAAALPPLSPEQLALARQYAYCYFQQRLVPLPVVKDPRSKWGDFQYRQRRLLLPGRDPFLDFICARLLDGRDFVMEEELVGLAEKVMAA
jgi:hypothetical protein